MLNCCADSGFDDVVEPPVAIGADCDGWRQQKEPCRDRVVARTVQKFSGLRNDSD